MNKRSPIFKDADYQELDQNLIEWKPKLYYSIVNKFNKDKATKIE